MSDAEEAESAALRAALEKQHVETLIELRTAADEVAGIRRAAAEREAVLQSDLDDARARIEALERVVAELGSGPVKRLTSRLGRGRSGD